MENEKKYIFDKPQNIKRVLYFLYACCVLLFLLDFVIHRHIVHSWENVWGFYPIYGFVGCVVLVLVATWMRTFLMRSEDYYDNDKIDITEKPDANENPDSTVKHNTTSGGHNVDA